MSTDDEAVDVIELASTLRPARLEGYPSFAQFIASDGDAAIYRKYANLSARNLLYLQSELHDLEEQLQRLDQEDAKDIGNEEAQKVAREWDYYIHPDNQRASQHRSLQSKIKNKLREYQEAIVLESKILALNPPSRRTLTAFKQWFTLSSIPVLWGRDRHLFDDEKDLVALAPVETDRLNIFLQNYFGWFFRCKKEGLPNESIHEIFYYPQRHIQTAGAVISIISSAVLLLGAIVCLLLIADQSIHLRVGMIVIFTCLFALVVGLLTNARRAEIFGATAAYAAVLVVFAVVCAAFAFDRDNALLPRKVGIFFKRAPNRDIGSGRYEAVNTVQNQGLRSCQRARCQPSSRLQQHDIVEGVVEAFKDKTGAASSNASANWI